MLFHSFLTQEDRRALGGSAFLEFQHCRLNAGKPIRQIVSAIDHWQTDSLYVHVNDMECFYEAYAGILGSATYQNGKNGPLDIYGIHYYPPEKTNIIVKALQEKQPPEYKILLEWLSRDGEGGFYLLGL